MRKCETNISREEIGSFDPSLENWCDLRLTYRPTLSSRTEYALFRTAGHMRLVDPSTFDDKAFLEFGGKIQMTQMTPDIAAAY